MISKKTKYALKALEYLAQKCTSEPVLISEIAAKERIPQKFLEAILLEMKNDGILQSKKGKKGGYFLARPAKEITLGEVMRLLEGPLAPLPCVSQTAYKRCDECIDENTCGIRMVMRDVRDATAKILDQTTLADVVEKTQTACVQSGKLVSFDI
jgi:Rrf2 family protein